MPCCIYCPGSGAAALAGYSMDKQTSAASLQVGVMFCMQEASLTHLLQCCLCCMAFTLSISCFGCLYNHTHGCASKQRINAAVCDNSLCLCITRRGPHWLFVCRFVSIPSTQSSSTKTKFTHLSLQCQVASFAPCLTSNDTPATPAASQTQP